jgi:hypothetical protein
MVLRGGPRRVGAGGTVWGLRVCCCDSSSGCCAALGRTAHRVEEALWVRLHLDTFTPFNLRDELQLPLAGLGSDLQLHVSFVHSFVILSSTLCACCLCAQGCTPTQGLQQLLQRVLPLWQ